MRIAVDARIIATTTGRYVERLLEHLQQLDAKNEYIVMLLDKDYDRWEPSAPNFSKVRANFRQYSLGEQIGFAIFLYQLRVDLVHFTMPHYPVGYLKPRVVTVHDLTLIDYVNRRKEGLLRDLYKQRVKPAVFKLIMRWTAKTSTAIIVPTMYVREQIMRRLGAPGGRVTVTYEAADALAAEATKPNYGQGEEFLLYVGNAYPYKNLWRLIQAFQRLHRPGLKLVFVGPKDYFYEQLEQQTRSAGIEGVIFTGYVPDSELVWLYKHARLYVFPSLSEGFGLPPLEAMQYGLPVAASRASCLPEVYEDAAVYFNPKDPEEIADVVDGLLADRKRREELARAGSARVKQFSWSRMAEQTLQVYRRAGSGRG